MTKLLIRQAILNNFEQQNQDKSQPHVVAIIYTNVN